MSHGRPIHQICCSCVKLRSCFLCPSGCRKAMIGHATAPGWYHSHIASIQLSWGWTWLDGMDWSPGQSSIASRPFPSPKPSLTASTCYAAGLMVIQLIRYCRWEGDFVVKRGCALKVCFPESFASWWWSAFEISWNFRSCCDRHKPQNWKLVTWCDLASASRSEEKSPQSWSNTSYSNSGRQAESCSQWRWRSCHHWLLAKALSFLAHKMKARQGAASPKDRFHNDNVYINY